jgi:hypothetical protein
VPSSDGKNFSIYGKITPSPESWCFSWIFPCVTRRWQDRRKENEMPLETDRCHF